MWSGNTAFTQAKFVISPRIESALDACCAQPLVSAGCPELAGMGIGRGPGAEDRLAGDD
jgi:hypothetical protein